MYIHDSILYEKEIGDKSATRGVFFWGGGFPYADFMEEAMVVLAARGEDNLARNDLALLEKSHRIEVLRILDK